MQLIQRRRDFRIESILGRIVVRLYTWIGQYGRTGRRLLPIHRQADRVRTRNGAAAAQASPHIQAVHILDRLIPQVPVHPVVPAFELQRITGDGIRPLISVGADHILTIRLNRPERKNAINATMAAENISTNTSAVASAAQQTRAGAATTDEAAAEMRNVSVDLANLISRFRV